jgi:cytochrome d ubiquinol oxidase subunit II
VVSVWTPQRDPLIWSRWMSEPRVYFIWLFPLLGAGAFFTLLGQLKRRTSETMPFLAAVTLFISAYLGLQAAIFPYAILPDVTIYDAAAQPATQIFTLWGVALVLPFVLGYTIYSYRVFKGKVAAGEGYH